METKPKQKKKITKPKQKSFGRPSIYNANVLIQTRKYLNSCKDKEEEFHKTRGEKSDGFERILNVKLPTIEGLAVFLHISRETIYAWCKEYTDFSDIIEELRTKQADALISNGLSGNYNSTIAKVLLTKHGYKEGIEHGGEDGEPIKIDITKMLDKAYGEPTTLPRDS